MSNDEIFSGGGSVSFHFQFDLDEKPTPLTEGPVVEHVRTTNCAEQGCSGCSNCQRSLCVHRLALLEEDRKKLRILEAAIKDGNSMFHTTYPSSAIPAFTERAWKLTMEAFKKIGGKVDSFQIYPEPVDPNLCPCGCCVKSRA